MVEAGYDLGFLQIEFYVFRLINQAAVGNLNGNLPLQRLVVGPIDRTKRTLA